MILDGMIAEGNLDNVDLAIMMLDRQKKLHGRYPLKACFASKNNLNTNQS